MCYILLNNTIQWQIQIQKSGLTKRYAASCTIPLDLTSRWWFAANGRNCKVHLALTEDVYEYSGKEALKSITLLLMYCSGNLPGGSNQELQKTSSGELIPHTDLKLYPKHEAESYLLGCIVPFNECCYWMFKLGQLAEPLDIHKVLVSISTWRLANLQLLSILSDKRQHNTTY